MHGHPGHLLNFYEPSAILHGDRHSNLSNKTLPKPQDQTLIVGTHTHAQRSESATAPHTLKIKRMRMSIALPQSSLIDLLTITCVDGWHATAKPTGPLFEDQVTSCDYPREIENPAFPLTTNPLSTYESLGYCSWLPAWEIRYESQSAVRRSFVRGQLAGKSWPCETSIPGQSTYVAWTTPQCMRINGAINVHSMVSNELNPPR